MAKVKLEKLEGSVDELVDIIKNGDVSIRYILRKDKSRVYLYLWWEDKEKWFINVAHGNSVGPDCESSWMTSRDLRVLLNAHSGCSLYEEIK